MVPAANPVTKAPLAASAGDVVTKICAAASAPLTLLTNTDDASFQSPDVLVRPKLIVLDECVYPSKLLIV